MSGPQPEKRGAPRIEERCTISYRAVEKSENNPKRIAAQTLNLSSSGLCLLSDEALMPDRHLALELQIEEREEPFVAIGRVVWCDRDGDRYRIGICFTWLREEDRRDLGAIGDYVKRRLEE